MFGSGDLGMGITFSFKDDASGPANNAGNNVSGLSQAVDKAAKSIMDSASKITSGIIAVTAAVSFLMAPFVASVGASMEFNFQISRAGAIAHATANEVTMLKQAAFQLGSTTMYSATEIAKTEVVLAQAGFAVQQQLELLPGITNLAEAGVVSLDYAAGLASDTLFQFGLQTRDMERVGDVIVQAANMSNMSVENFGNAMKYLGPTAKAFGIELEEAAGFIEMMANSGMRGSIGTRAFGTSLVNLASPTKQAADEMARLGFDAYDSAGKFVGLEQMTRRLQTSLTGLTNKERDKALSLIFGNEAIQEMVQLLTLEFTAIEDGVEVTYRGADALEYFTQKNLEAKGVAAEVSRGMMDNLKSDVALMTSAFETLGIKMGDIQEGPLRSIVTDITSLINIISDLVATPLGEWIVGLTAVTAALASGMIILGFVITILGPAIWSMVVAAGALMIELLPVIAVIAALAGTFLVARESLSLFQEAMNEETAPATGFMGILQKMGGVLTAVAEIWSSWNGETYTLSQGTHDALQKIGILDFVLNLGTWIVRIKEFFNGFVEAAVFAYVIVEASFQYLSNSVSSFFKALEDAGIPLGKLMGDMSLFQTMGYAVGVMVQVITAPIVILTSALSFLASTLEWVVVNWKEMGKFFDVGAWAMGLGMAEQGDWSMMPGANFKSTYAQGSMTNASSKTSFDPYDLSKRQAEIMGQLGMKSNFTPANVSGQNNTTGGNTQVSIPVYLDSSKISESIVDLQKMSLSRQ